MDVAGEAAQLEVRSLLSSRGWPRRARALRPILALALLLAACGPDSGRERMLGRWVNARDSIEILPDGRVLLYTPARSTAGRYLHRGAGRIEVDLGVRHASGEPRIWLAMPGRHRLALCEIANGRHCILFHRPKRSVSLNPR